MSKTTLAWVAKASNRKTGPIPTAYVGRDPREALESCAAVACPLLGNGCYAWAGQLAQGHGSVRRAAQAGSPRYGLAGAEWALRNRHGRIRSVRFGALGDPAHVRKPEIRGAVRRVREAGLAVLGYTHGWRQDGAQHLRDDFMASCEDPRGTKEALRKGWRPTQVVPWHVAADGPLHTDPDTGVRLLGCPAQRTKDATTCDDCRLCDPKNPWWDRGVADGIAFYDHSPKARKEREKSGQEA